MKKDITRQVNSLLTSYDPGAPNKTAYALREFWLQFKPKSMGGIKAELRAQQETVGIPVPILKSIGKSVARAAAKQVDDFLPLARLLWEGYGREGRVVAVHPLGAMELSQPNIILPLLKTLCATCLTWEDADHFAMNALEQIVRKKPEKWLSAIEPWLEDENKWVRRAGVTVVGRLAMKHPGYTTRCLETIECLLHDEEVDVKKAVSFAIRLAARGEVEPVIEFLARNVPPENPLATWVLCDAIRSMTKKLLPQFTPLLPRYEKWAANPDMSTKDRRSVESAIKTLKTAQE
jgi:3-methyladenine DNA glycosylase AlkD